MSRFDPPVIGDPSPVRFPAATRTRLDNGVLVRALAQSASPLVTLVCLADAGTAVDPPDRAGLASLTAALMTEGAGDRDSLALSDALARIGGHLDVEVVPDGTVLTLTLLARHVATGVALAADIVQRPRLADADFARVRELRLSRLAQTSRLASVAADRALAAAVFGDHPYAHGALGTTRALQAATVDDARRWWAAAWRPAGTTVLVVGDVDEAVAERTVTRAFESWRSEAAPAPAIAPPTGLAAPEILLVDRPGAPQAEVRLGHLGPNRCTPDYHALVLLNAVVGGQFTSRINRNLRETRAITYGARSGFDMRRAGGLFSCEASVQADATAVAVSELLRELDEVRADGAIGDAELVHARASLTRGYVRHFETAGQLARALIQLAIHDLPDDTFDRFVPEINALPGRAVAEAARRALHPERAVAVVVGDGETLLPSLGLLSRPIRRVDPEF